MSISDVKLRAAFQLDGDGNPRFVPGGALESGEPLKHWEIEISVEGAPRDAYAVTYELDPTYYEARREVPREEENFKLHTTSYGDFGVRARVRSKGFTDLATRDLVDALRETHGNDPSPAIQAALAAIAKF
jgi:hypothetical protein